MRAVLFASLMLAAACSRPEASPPTLDELSRGLMRDFEDTELVTQHIDALYPWLDADGREQAAWDGLLLSNLTLDDLTPPLPTDDDLDAHRGLAVAAASPFALDEHVALMVREDQTFVDPGSFDLYERTFRESDPDAFVAQQQDVLRTRNDIIKSGAFGVTIPYLLDKDYRWVVTADGRRAVVARGWLEQSGCSDNGNNCVHQSWALEALVEHEGETLRLYAVWLEVVTQADSVLSEDARINLIAKGNQDIIEATDDELAGE